MSHRILKKKRNNGGLLPSGNENNNNGCLDDNLEINILRVSQDGMELVVTNSDAVSGSKNQTNNINDPVMPNIQPVHIGTLSNNALLEHSHVQSEEGNMPKNREFQAPKSTVIPKTNGPNKRTKRPLDAQTEYVANKKRKRANINDFQASEIVVSSCYPTTSQSNSQSVPVSQQQSNIDEADIRNTTPTQSESAELGTNSQKSKDAGYLMELSFESNSSEENPTSGAVNYSIDLSNSLSSEEDEVPIVRDIDTKNFTWTEHSQFDTLDNAKAFMAKEGFSQYDFKDLNVGAKFYYRCNKISRTKSKVWCNRRYIIFLPSESSRIVLLHNSFEHNHSQLLDAKDGASKKLSMQMLKFIKDLFDKKVTSPLTVIRQIEMARTEQGIFLDEQNPTLRQIEYRLSVYRRSEAKSVITVDELAEWCEKYSSFPTDPNELFSLGFQSSPLGENMKFIFCLSTPLLLRKLATAEILCIDATYKLNWMGFPLIVMGTVDRANRFHPLCYGCTSHETTEDYAFVFRSVKNAVEKYIGLACQVKILVADGADAIRNAFYSVFDQAKLDVMCYVHVLRNITRRPFKSILNKPLILQDVQKIHLASNEDEFNLMSKLFCEKWQNIEPDFIKYFEKEWLGNHRNWYEGASIFAPSHNNGVESHNAYIKRTVTFRKRLPLNQFLSAMKELTIDISKQFDTEIRKITDDPIIKREVNIEAARLIMNSFKHFKAKSKSGKDEIVYVVPSSTCESDNANEKHYKYLLKRTWESFDEFVRYGFQKFWIVIVSIDKWQSESKCTCPYFFKQHICKHIIAIAVELELYEFPSYANPTCLTKKKKKGRPPLASLALLVP